MKKIVSIIIILIVLSGCSGIVKVNSITKEQTVLSMKKIYDEMQKYKEDTNYTFYKIEDKYATNSSVWNFFRGSSGYKIGEKYSTEFAYFSPEHFFIYQYGKSKEKIYENDKVSWEMYYHVTGYKYRINNIEKFELNIKNKENRQKIKIEIGELTAYRKDKAQIPEIKNIEYKGEKIFFEIKEEMNDISIVRNEEEIGRIFFRIPEIEIDAKLAFLAESKDGHGGIYIKNNIDEELKSFLFKCTLMQLQHKMMGAIIKKEMEIA